MGPEPLERLHVSLINTATALDTVPLINIRIKERDRRGGCGGNQPQNIQRNEGKVQEKESLAGRKSLRSR